MKTICVGVVLVLATCLVSSTCVFGQSPTPGKSGALPKSGAQAQCATADENASAGFEYRAAVLGDLEDVGKKLVDLAKAMPEDKFTWKPSGPDSLTTSEVYLLAATEYYHLPSEFGTIAAAGYEFGGDAVTARRQATQPLEKAITNKSDVLTEVVDSISYFNGIMPTVSDNDLQKKIKILGRDTTPSAALMVLDNDEHEYLAQAMDYARLNGIALPWMAQHQDLKRKRGERTPFK